MSTTTDPQDGKLVKIGKLLRLAGARPPRPRRPPSWSGPPALATEHRVDLDVAER